MLMLYAVDVASVKIAGYAAAGSEWTGGLPVWRCMVLMVGCQALSMSCRCWDTHPRVALPADVPFDGRRSN